MTMPVLIQHHKNTVVETRLKKFYSAINQAVVMAENDYGDKIYWYEDLEGAQTDADGNLIPGSSDAEKWFNKYLAPYMKILKTEELADGTFIVYFPDGSALKQFKQDTTRDWLFFPQNAAKCMDGNPETLMMLGKCAFAFNFQPRALNQDWKYHNNKGFEPWMWQWDGTRDTLLNGCKGETPYFCTALIQYEGWKIPKDYPQRISY